MNPGFFLQLSACRAKVIGEDEEIVESNLAIAIEIARRIADDRDVDGLARFTCREGQRSSSSVIVITGGMTTLA